MCCCPGEGAQEGAGAAAAAVLQLCDILVLHGFTSNDRSKSCPVAPRVFLTPIWHKSPAPQHCGGGSRQTTLSTTLVRRPSPHPPPL